MYVLALMLIEQYSINTDKNVNLSHIKPGALNVYIYHGDRKEIDSDVLTRYDIVITTYSTIRMEFFPSKRNSQPRKSPISEINWFRVVLDEGTTPPPGAAEEN